MTKLLANVHIEKCAGTSLNHLLRRAFFLRYLDIVPHELSSSGLLSRADVERAYLLNPFLLCISGHSIVPWIQIAPEGVDVTYITVLRDPVQRYLSRYEYLVDAMGHPIEFVTFLESPGTWNFQTRKLDRHGTVEGAKETLGRFAAVGLVERFPTFLRMMQALYPDRDLDAVPEYVNQTSSSATDRRQKLLDKFGDAIVERNRLDLDLYHFVESRLLPNLCEQLNVALVEESDGEKEPSRKPALRKVKAFVDFGARRMYLRPTQRLLRRRHALPAEGAYGFADHWGNSALQAVY